MTAVDIRTRMRTDLTTAMKRKDKTAIAALRSAIAALDNAEAIDVTDLPATSDATGVIGPAPSLDPSSIAGATAGLGTTEATRRALTDDDIAGVIAAEIGERIDAAEHYERAGEIDRSAVLRAEADVLKPYLEATP